MQDTAYFRVKCVAFFLFTLAGTSLLWLGCGKKGPPRPPPQTLPAAVKDLSYRINQDMVKLKWTVAGKNDQSPSYPAAVKLFRSKQSTAESSCEKCPIRFSEIADLPVQLEGSGQSESSTMTFTEALERGYRYIYKVVVYNRDGLGGKDSNTVEFSF